MEINKDSLPLDWIDSIASALNSRLVAAAMSRATP